MTSLSSRTAYVLLSSIETDLRDLIDTHAGENDPTSVLGKDVLQRAKDRRSRDGLSSGVEHVTQVLPYLDFQDSFDGLMRMEQSVSPALYVGIRQLVPRVPALVEARNRVAHNRPLEMDDLPGIVDFAHDLLLIPGFDWSETSRVCAEMRTDASYVLRAAANLIVDPNNVVANNLPAPDFDETSLLGRREERRNIGRALRGSWPVVSILGDGGIGKTALALQVCFDLVSSADCPFDAVVWVTAKNSQLTSTEIVRIESAVQDSLGLFASATAAVGGTGDSSQAVVELLEVLASFPTLLVLDNVETVLDEHFPEFLAEIPNGSKVLITSRIGVKTENPFRLTSLSTDDAARLIRILARVRGVEILKRATDEDLVRWATQMGCHPAYIKWFVAGVQAGRTPEALLSDNGLILDFCMSNVFDFLGEASRSALASMLVIPGSHTLSELAFLNDLGATQAHAVISELTTTNFVSQVRSGAAGTAYELSDFARSYLRRTLNIGRGERQRLVERHRQLYEFGGGMQTAHALDPFSPTTIDTRGVGDYSAARHLRDALDHVAAGRYDQALVLCAEAAELAPGYHEVDRVEGYVHESMANFVEAFESYSRARDLAPQNPYVAYALGTFLLTSGFDPRTGLLELQRAAKLFPNDIQLQLAVCDAHVRLGATRDSIDAATYAVEQACAAQRGISESAFALARAYSLHSREEEKGGDWSALAEDVQSCRTSLEGLDPTLFNRETLDLCLHLEVVAQHAAEECADNFIAQNLTQESRRLREIRRRSDLTHLERLVGEVDHLSADRGFGFLKVKQARYFLHASEMLDRRSFEYLEIGSRIVFNAGSMPRRGNTPALSAYWVA